MFNPDFCGNDQYIYMAPNIYVELWLISKPVKHLNALAAGISIYNSDFQIPQATAALPWFLIMMMMMMEVLMITKKQKPFPFIFVSHVIRNIFHIQANNLYLISAACRVDSRASVELPEML